MLLADAVALRLKELITEKGLTQYKLFKLTGVPQSTISTIMTGKNKTYKLDTILLLAQGLGVSAMEFFNKDYFDYATLNLD